MIDTTTTPPPARGGVKHCQYCGDQFTHGQRDKYCSDECAHGAALRRKRKWNRSNLKSTPPVVVPPMPHAAPAPRRASTLAETPDVPAVTAARGEYLTGAAAATMQAVSGGRNLSL